MVKFGEYFFRVNEVKVEGEEFIISGNDEERQCFIYDKKVVFKEEVEGVKGLEDEFVVVKLNFQKCFGFEFQICRVGFYNFVVNGDESLFCFVVNKVDFYVCLQLDVRLIIEEDDDEEEV